MPIGEGSPERREDAARGLQETRRQPDAVKPSDTWSKWSSVFAWRERAAAYNDHLASKRREAYERGIAEESERQGALPGRTRNRMNEI